MHELSIAASLVEIASEEAARLGDVKVEAVRLRIGRLAGVARDALLFSFDVAAAGSAVEGARLEIEEVPAAIWCDRCRAEHELEDAARRRCPACGSAVAALVRGEELQLTALEVHDP